MDIAIAKYLISDCNCDPEYITDLDIQGLLHFTVHVRTVVSKLQSISSLNTNAILNMAMILAIHLYMQLLAMASLEPRLFVLDFSPKLRDKIRNGKPGFEASNPQIADIDDFTPLHAACINGHLDITKYLILECNCNLKCLKHEGDSPLHCACENGHLKVAKHLITEHN